MPDYTKPDPDLLEKVRTASDGSLRTFLRNARAKLPDAQWFADAIVAEQLRRGGLQNINANSVREVILQYAKRRKTCTYKTIAEELGVEWSQAHWRLPKILGEVSEMEHGCGRPMLTAIVVSQKGKCGGGFFEMARRAGTVFSDEERFQEEEQQGVFDYWSS